MKEYKVINEFGSAKKGDVLEYDEEQDLYIMNITEKDSSRYMAMDQECADSFVNKGFLIALEEDEELCENCEKLLKLDQFVDEAMAQYKKDNENMLEEYSTGSIPTCVKVESETVYYNVNKVLKKIKELING